MVAVNNKSEARKGKVQLIDASLLFRKLRKNLGDKNCEFAPEHIAEITQNYLDFTAKAREIDSQNEAVGLASQILTIKISAITKSPSNARIAVLPNLPQKISSLYGLTKPCLSRCNIFIGNMADKFTTPDF